MLRLIYCVLTLGVFSMPGCRSGRPVVGTSDACAAVPVIPVAPDSDMLSAAIADTENEVCLADSIRNLRSVGDCIGGVRSRRIPFG